jgi:hypothetical protein
MELTPLQCVVIDAPLPALIPRHRPAVHKETMFTMLGTMEVGGKAVEVNRSKRAVQGYIQRFRLQIEAEAQFVIRDARSGWTAIWRVK